MLRTLPIVVSDGDTALQGLLVLKGPALVAVLSQLSADYYESNNGRWFVEALFGVPEPANRVFEDPDSAVAWLSTAVASSR